VRRPFARPVLACGAHLKNAVCLGVGGSAWMSPPVGDLETLEACEAFERSVEVLERALGVRAEVVAHDLHPDYYSTQYALRRTDASRIAVQHHHAHVASAIAGHGIEGAVLGIAFDGTGLGTDGTAWGGEILRADRESFDRLATLRPIPLAGGDQAIREPWRIALALLDDAFAGDPPLDRIPLFRRISRDRIAAVRALVAAGVRSPLAHGLGRYFDAAGSLVLDLPVSAREGEVAVAWNLAADPDRRGIYPFAIDRDGAAAEIDFRPLVRALVDELLRGVSPASISARFHDTIGAATALAVGDAMRLTGPLPVVLTGGCFQNALLTERIRARLLPRGPVFVHGAVPPGDAGLALGQALVADTLARRS
jgi:hydrogenase maturation protein HypF